MCGRVVVISPLRLFDEFSITRRAPVFEIEPRYNIAPTGVVPAVRLVSTGEAEAVWLRWGLVPSWAKDMHVGHALFNARVETVTEKPAFRAAFRARRCVVAVDGFYEWQRTGKVRQPYYFRRGDGRLVLMAGLWERWTTPEGTPLESCSIVTKPAAPPVDRLHDRMPAILDVDRARAFLSAPAGDTEALAHLTALLLEPSPLLSAHPVSPRVNSPAFQGPACIAPIEEERTLF